MSESAPDFERQWKQFITRIEANEARLIAESSSAWADVRSILEAELGDWGGRLPTLPSDLTPEELTALRGEAADLLLHAPTSLLLRRRPLRRVLGALDAYDRGLQDALLQLPEDTVLFSRSLALAVPGCLGGALGRGLLRLSSNPRPVQLRAAASAALESMQSRRLAVERRFVEAICSAIRLVRVPWEIVRDTLDTLCAGDRVRGPEVSRQIDVARDRRRAGERAAEEALAALGEWGRAALPRVARRMVLRFAVPLKADAFPSGTGRARRASWVAKSRALDAEILFGTYLEKSERQILSVSSDALQGLQDELKAVTADLDAAIRHLQGPVDDVISGDFPQPAAELAPAVRRLADLEDGMRAALRALPRTSDALPLSRTILGSGSQAPEPAEVFWRCYARVARPRLMRFFTTAVGRHSRLQQEIEHAREVVSFAHETVRTGGLDPASAGEAVRNALLSLEAEKDRSDDPQLRLAGLVRPLVIAFAENRFLLGRHRFGAAARHARHEIRFVSTSALSSARTAIRGAAVWSWQASERVVTWLLDAIGWKAAPKAGVLEVIARPYLPSEFTVDLASKDLPAVYRHLFRFEPLDDPRFLVGREREMEAIEDARSHWETGRPVAVLLVGARGSGKTSLINCALKRCLGGLNIVRGEFSQRIFTGVETRRFLADLVGCVDPDRLEETLTRRKPVVIIEEVERCYLRQVGGFGAIRELLKVIASTCSSTFWILAINDIAFQVLNASVDMGRTFSHRINAGTATRDDIREAILLRHNLSGLRVHYPAVPVPESRVRRLLRRVDDDGDPERHFFGLVARESAGVYRAAFDIWLGQIESAQSGILYLKALEVPDLSPLIDGLSQDEIFSLAAIPQHGGLTVDEHARVFRGTPAASQAVIDGLLAREIIEPDPGRAGFRIRPEANRVVREALYRRNLIG